MPRRKPCFERADIRAAWKLMEDIGLEPVSVKVHKDGTFRIMTKKHAEITAAKNTDHSGNPHGKSEWDLALGT